MTMPRWKSLEDFLARRRGVLLKTTLALLGITLTWVTVSTWMPQTTGPATQVTLGETSFETRLSAALQEIENQELSVIVGISHGEEDVVLREFGSLANDGIPPETTQIDINSITKTVTGVMVAKLVQQGRLRFDEPLSEIFGNVPQDKAEITIHQLLTHSGGFPEAIGDDGEAIGRDEFLERAWATELLSRPGTSYHYSNTGYGVLAAVVELSSGKSYEAYLREEVLRSEDFVNTGYEAVYDPSRSMLSEEGHSIRQASWGRHSASWHLIGNGGLVSTVPEMIEFRRAFRKGNLVPFELVDVVQHRHQKEGEEPSFYGYGLVVQDAPGVGRYYWHDGGNDVFTAKWVDLADTDDILFTAGQNEAAMDAMSILMRHLYGFDG